MKQIVFKGFIRVIEELETCDGICIGESGIIEEEFQAFDDKQVSIRYWISDEELTKEELVEASVRSLVGGVYAVHESAYSEYTGYLWTNNHLEVGGHDLRNELYDANGKYIYMEVDVHESNLKQV